MMKSKICKSTICLILGVILCFSSVIPVFAASCPFTDIKGHWAEYYIKYVWQDQELMRGVSDTKFSPDNYLKRSEATAIMFRMCQRYEHRDLTQNCINAQQNVFKDVPANNEYSKFILWAKNNGIISGYNDGTFRPDSYITREEFCSILFRYAGYVEDVFYTLSNPVVFKDQSNITDWAIPCVDFMRKVGVARGYPNGYFYPTNNLQRCEAANLIYWYTNMVRYQSGYHTTTRLESVDDAIAADQYLDASALEMFEFEDEQANIYILAVAGATLMKDEWPDAAGLLLHYLGASGDTYTTFNLKGFVNEEKSSQKAVFTDNINSFITAAETYEPSTSIIYLSDRREKANKMNSSGDGSNWYYAIGQYRTSTHGTFSKNGKLFSATISYNLKDYYDWDPGSTETFFNMAVSSLYQLARYGYGRNFHNEATIVVTVSWAEGQRIGTGASYSIA